MNEFNVYLTTQFLIGRISDEKYKLLNEEHGQMSNVVYYAEVFEKELRKRVIENNSGVSNFVLFNLTVNRRTIIVRISYHFDKEIKEPIINGEYNGNINKPIISFEITSPNREYMMSNTTIARLLSITIG